MGQAKVAFKQAIDKNITPLLNKVEAAIDVGIDKVDQGINKTFSHIEIECHEGNYLETACSAEQTHDVEEIISKATQCPH